MGCHQRDEPLTLMRRHSYMKSLKNGRLSVDKPKTSGHKEENIFLFHFFSYTDILSLI